MGYQHEWDHAIESLKAMHKRGVRILFGGDYGFAMTPHCQNARDLEFFVKYLGFTPGEAIRCATLYGGQIMMKANELGQIKEGYLADLLLVDGDPMANLAILRDPQRLLAVMKDGVFAKAPDIAAERAWGVQHDLQPAALDSRPVGYLAAAGRADRRVRGLGHRRQRQVVLHHAAQFADAGVVVLSGGQRLHAGVRPDAQRQPRAWISVPAGRLHRLGGGRADRVMGVGGGGRLPHRGPGRPADAGAGLPAHAGAGPAPDVGDDRAVDRAGRRDAMGMGRRDLHLRAAGVDLRFDRAAVGREISDLSHRRVRDGHGDRPAAVVVPGAYACRHDDPRRRRRPRHARRLGRQRAAAVRAHLCHRRRPCRAGRRGGRQRAVDARLAKTRVTCWRR